MVGDGGLWWWLLLLLVVLVAGGGGVGLLLVAVMACCWWCVASGFKAASTLIFVPESAKLALKRIQTDVVEDHEPRSLPLSISPEITVMVSWT